MQTVTVFRYLDTLDAFVVTDDYRHLAEALGLAEWHPVVWLGRLFTLDNDFGEHGFDHGERREAKAAAAALGLDPDELLIIDPERFQDGRDGPCHPPALRKQFWSEVLQGLTLSHELVFAVARHYHAEAQRWTPEEAIGDLEQRITALRQAAGLPRGEG